MQYQQEQQRSTPGKAKVLVAAAPGDPRAIRLANDLREMGWDVLLAETPDAAGNLASEAICIAVLRPRYWNAPPIAAMVNANPPYLIPVLAEPMSLPRGPWSFEPIPMNSPQQVAEETAQAVEDGVRALGLRRPSVPRRNSAPRPAESFAGVSTGSGVMNRTAARGSVLQTTTETPARPETGNSRVATVVISLIVLGIVAFGGYKYGWPHLKRFLARSMATPVPSAMQSYSTAKPGPACDANGGVWEPLNDATLSGSCASTGYTLTKSGSFDVAGEIFFDGRSHVQFPQDYRVTVTETILSGDATTAVGLEVHRQTPKGGQLLTAQSTGWYFALNDTNGNPARRLALGFFKQQVKAFTFVVEVHGPVMTLTINGVKVDTVTDTTYTTTSAIALVLADPEGKAPISARYSAFTYQPLPRSSMSAFSAQATATATAKAEPAYKAAVPGPGCDTGKGQWDPTDFGDPTTQVKCLSNGLQITQSASAGTPGQVHFYNLDGNFPANYSVGVTADLSAANNGCAGIFVRTSENGSYHIYVCANGQWRIHKTSTNADIAIGQIFLNTTQPTQLLATARGSTISLSINGSQVAATKDVTTPLTETDDVSLAANAGTGNAVITFSNFVFTPLP